MNDLPKPLENSIFYEDENIYACLASYPIMRGHSVVVWKERRDDLGSLSKEEYSALMNVVDVVRNQLISSLGVEKVYLVYMDEIKHVHWHLFPRYDEEGFTVLSHPPGVLTDTSLAGVFKSNLATFIS